MVCEHRTRCWEPFVQLERESLSSWKIIKEEQTKSLFEVLFVGLQFKCVKQTFLVLQNDERNIRGKSMSALETENGGHLSVGNAKG